MKPSNPSFMSRLARCLVLISTLLDFSFSILDLEELFQFQVFLFNFLDRLIFGTAILIIFEISTNPIG